MTPPLTLTNLRAEIEGIRALVEGVSDALTGPVPQVTTDATDAETELYWRQVRATLKLVAGRCMNLANVLEDEA